MALAAILLPVASLLGFLWLNWLVAFLVLFGAMSLSQSSSASAHGSARTTRTGPKPVCRNCSKRKDYLDV